MFCFGFSGSGKSSLVLEELVPAVEQALLGNKSRVVPTKKLLVLIKLVIW